MKTKLFLSVTALVAATSAANAISMPKFSNIDVNKVPGYASICSSMQTAANKTTSIIANALTSSRIAEFAVSKTKSDKLNVALTSASTKIQAHPNITTATVAVMIAGLGYITYKKLTKQPKSKEVSTQTPNEVATQTEDIEESIR